MKARITISLVTGLCLAALMTFGWASDTGSLVENNEKGLTLKTTGVQRLETRQTLSVQREVIASSQALPPSGPEVIYTLSGDRQGGDNIASAAVIPAMPFVDTGTTVGYTDDYSESCDDMHYAARPDVVYEYTPEIDELVDIILCNSSFCTRLWVYEGDETNMVACNRFDATQCSLPRSALMEVPMDSGLTYYFVIDGDYQLTPTEGEYVIECNAIPAPQPTDSVRRWPTLAGNAAGNLVFGYSFNNGVDSSQPYMPSLDDGATWEGAVQWLVSGWPKYASIEYWGQDTLFYGTFVPDPSDADGGDMYVHWIYNGTNTNQWQLSSWPWSNYGFHDMRMADVACQEGVYFSETPGDHAFGFLSMVHTTTYDQGIVDGPFTFYQIDEEGYGTIDWFWDLDSCRSTMVDIDPVTFYVYSVWDWYDTATSQYQLLVRGDLLGDPDDTAGFYGLYGYALDPGQHVGYPAVAANDGNVLVVAELEDEASPGDHDIIMFYSPDLDGRYDNMVSDVVVATAADERYPRIQHISGDNYVVSYIADNQVYLTVTTDAGQTWEAPYVVSGDDHVVSEYRATDFTDDAMMIVWEYQPGLPDDTSIFLHFGPTDVIQDGDGDGWADGEDNCPDLANAGQEDDDLDGIGNVCDECTDTDGDGYGNPGHAANTCADDNCPDVPNADQADTNQDGIGDACCCEGMRGNMDGIGAVNVADLTFAVDYLFKQGPNPPCPDECDVNMDTRMNVDDLSYLVNFLFKQGPDPMNCE